MVLENAYSSFQLNCLYSVDHIYGVDKKSSDVHGPESSDGVVRVLVIQISNGCVAVTSSFFSK